MHVADFLTRHHILWEPVRLREGTKRPIPFNDGVIARTNDFRQLSEDEIVRRQGRYRDETPYIYIDTRFVHIMDCDRDCEAAWDRVADLPYHLSLTKQLPHAFVRPSHRIGARANRVDIGDGVELLKGQPAIAPQTAPMYNYDASIEHPISTDTTTAEISNAEAGDNLLQMIKAEFWRDHRVLHSIVAACVNCGIEKRAVEENCPSDTPYTVNNKWDQVQNNPQPSYTIRTLYYLAYNSLPSEFDDWKAVFEMYHYKILEGPTYVWWPAPHKPMYKYTQPYKFIDARSEYGPKMIKRWMLHPSQQNMFERLDWIPPPLETPDGVFNVYMPFWWENKDLPAYTFTDFSGCTHGDENGVDISEFYQRLYDIAGGNDNDYIFLVRWLGQMLIEPGVLPPVIAMFFSYNKGTGKNMLMEQLMSRVLGSSKHRLLPSGLSQMFPSYYKPRAKTIMCVADEVNGQQSRDYMPVLKGECTSETVQDNEKNGPAPFYHNGCRIVLLTNHPNAVDADQEQRRIAVFQHAGLISKHNRDFNQRMGRKLKSETHLLAFIRFLKDRAARNDEFDWRAHLPNPEILRSMVRANDPLIVRFLADYVANHDNDWEVFTFPTWCEKVHNWGLNSRDSISQRTQRWQAVLADTNQAISYLGQDLLCKLPKQSPRGQIRVRVNIAGLQQRFQDILYYE